MAPFSRFCQVTSVIWALVSDGKQAYVFKYCKDEIIFDEKVFAIGGSRVGARGAARPTWRIRNETVKQFIPTIALRLKEALDQKAFDYLVIVAPRETMAALKGALPEDLRVRVLTNMPDGYAYDKNGALFALRQESIADVSSPEASSLRSLPPCCTRPARLHTAANGGAYALSPDCEVSPSDRPTFYTIQ